MGPAIAVTIAVSVPAEIINNTEIFPSEIPSDLAASSPRDQASNAFDERHIKTIVMNKPKVKYNK
ncbi:MAG: hypothetical protein RL106_988 [Bacteroidota bacterium]